MKKNKNKKKTFSNKPTESTLNIVLIHSIIFVKEGYLVIILEYFSYFSIKTYVGVLIRSTSQHNMFFVWKTSEIYPRIKQSSEQITF